ncbi:MAG: glycosyltransferase family 4 protein [Patescibacteria group bacterium]|nr:glycosyltransferase family 4 protein [Patescibacteria group bacterium]
MKKLKIAQVAPPWYSLPPKKYGGIERIVHCLTAELVKRGHRVTLFASGDSKTSANLISSRRRALAKDKIPWSDTYWELEHLSFSFKKIKEGYFDIVHSHAGLRTIFFQDFIKTPLVYTFHNPLHSAYFIPFSGIKDKFLITNSKKLPPALKILKRHSKNLNVCFISKSQKRLSQTEFKNNWIVYNGIDTNLFKFSPESENFFLWVGRVEPKKGVENAIEAAEIANIKLYLAGKIDPERKEYFEKIIKPHLSQKIKYLGEISQNQLNKLYGEAKSVLFPIEWQEPFGLVMAEAQACGTPVISFKLGAAPEVVRDKKTGFVVPFLDNEGKKNIKGLVESIKNVDEIKREDCRKWIEENFTIPKMVNNYEKVYRELIEKK